LDPFIVLSNPFNYVYHVHSALLLGGTQGNMSWIFYNQDLWSILWYFKHHFMQRLILSQWLVPSFVATSINIINLWIIYFLAFLSVHIWLINVSPTEFNTLMTFVHTRRYSFIQVTYCFTTCKCIVKRLLLEWLLYQSISYIVRQISNYHLNHEGYLLIFVYCMVNLALKMNFQKLCLRIFEFSYPNVSHLLITKI